MGSGKLESAKPLKNPKIKQKPLRPNLSDSISKKKKKKKKDENRQIKNKEDKQDTTDGNIGNGNEEVQPASASQQLSFFLNQFQSSNGVQLSSLELESVKESCILDVSQRSFQDVSSLGDHMKTAFGPSWKEVLCLGKLMEGRIDPGSPAVLIISTSAIRSIELLRGMLSLTRECRAVKLFAKHMKIEEQVSLLKNRVNIASGTPSRIKKLIDIDALGLSRLAVILLDIRTDVKGYSLLTLPQVRDEFWDLYKTCFHQRLLEGDLRICLYGPIPNADVLKGKKKGVVDEC